MTAMQFVGEEHVAELGLSVGLKDRKRLSAQWEFVEIELFLGCLCDSLATMTEQPSKVRRKFGSPHAPEAIAT